MIGKQQVETKDNFGVPPRIIYEQNRLSDTHLRLTLPGFQYSLTSLDYPKKVRSTQGAYSFMHQQGSVAVEVGSLSILRIATHYSISV